MNGKRMTLFAVAAALLIAVAVFAGIYFTGGGETAPVLLPDTTESSKPDDTSAPEASSGVVSAQINPETVQAVIEKTLTRPGSYHRTLETQLFWSGGSQRSTVEVWALGGVTRMDVTEAGVVKHLILTEDALYIWYNEETAYYSAALESGGELPALADEFSTIPSYETVLSLDKSQILEASYMEWEGVNCVYVRAKNDQLGYEEEYYVEIETGLLVAAASYEAGRLVYEMKAGAVDLTAPETALFCLPGQDTPLIS